MEYKILFEDTGDFDHKDIFMSPKREPIAVGAPSDTMSCNNYKSIHCTFSDTGIRYGKMGDGVFYVGSRHENPQIKFDDPREEIACHLSTMYGADVKEVVPL